jgi:hypothetical protein
MFRLLIKHKPVQKSRFKKKSSSKINVFFLLFSRLLGWLQPRRQKTEGGPDAIKRNTSKGKLLARDRINLLIDKSINRLSFLAKKLKKRVNKLIQIQNSCQNQT